MLDLGRRTANGGDTPGERPDYFGGQAESEAQKCRVEPARAQSGRFGLCRWTGCALSHAFRHKHRAQR